MTGLELYGRSDTYGWIPESGSGFQKVTLFPTGRPGGWRLLRAMAGFRFRHGRGVWFLCHYERVEILLFALLLRLLGDTVFTMADSKFDDYPRILWREIGKRTFMIPYQGAMGCGNRSRDYLRFLGIPSDRAVGLYDALSLDRIRRLAGAPPAPAGIAHAERHFTIVARLVPKKNLFMALEAYALYAATASEPRMLHLCGNGPLESELKARAEALGIASLVVFHGFVQTGTVARLLASTLVLLLPSSEEQFGQVVIEAQAMGLPVILSDNCGARDLLVRSGANGFVIEPDNPAGMAWFMGQLASDEGLWRRMALAAQEFAPKGDVAEFVAGVRRLAGSLDLILITPDASRGGGGVSEVVRLLAHDLALRPEIRVEVVTLASRHLSEDLRQWPDVPVKAFKAFGPRNYGFSPGMVWYLLRRRADLMHVHGIWMFHVLAAAIWKVRWRRAVIVTPHGMLERWIMARSPNLKRLVSGLYQRRFLRRAEAVQVLTPSEARDVHQTTGADVRCVEIPNFLPSTHDSIPERPDWWCPEDESKCLFVFLGRIHEKKGWRALCAAWDTQCRMDPAFRDGTALVFCGWQDGSDDFPMIVGTLAAAHGNVRYVGPQYGAQKTASLKAASFFVLPSASEGLPMAILEAWAVGVPVLMTAACNLEEGFEVGAAIEIGTTEQEICAGLGQAFALTPEDQARMAKAGEALVAARFSQDAVMSKLMALYNEVSA